VPLDLSLMEDVQAHLPLIKKLEKETPEISDPASGS